MKYLFSFAQFFVSTLFIFSGLIKLNDPIGTAIKLEEYFEVFAQDIHPFFMSFVPFSLFLSVCLSSMEVILGLALLLEVYYKKVVSTLLSMIVFFTFLTFYSAYFDKVTDCGCFGDAIPLTPWQSFSKDIILLVMILFLFFKRGIPKWDKQAFKSRMTYLAASVVICGIISTVAIRYLPWIDFRDYKIGNNIKKLMQPQEPAKVMYTFKKGDEVVESMQYLSAEEGYEYQDMKILNEDKAVAKIQDYYLTDADGAPYTDESLKGKKLWIVMEKVDDFEVEKLKKLLSGLSNSDITPILLNADYEHITGFLNQNQIQIPYYFADKTVLKAMVRSNPGFLLVEEGVVKDKWHYNNMVSAEDLK